jgi:hypothetical protein
MGQLPAPSTAVLPPTRPVRPRWWTAPPTGLPRRALAGAGALAVAAGAALPTARPGVDVPLTAAGTIGLVIAAAPRPRSRGDAGLLALALGLSTVAAVRDSAWLTLTCLAAAVCLICAVVVRARTWAAVLLAVPMIGSASPPGLAWVTHEVRSLARPRGTASWVRGAALAATLAVVFGGLLAWADPVFTVVVLKASPGADVAMLPGQVFTAAVLAALLAGLLYAVRARARRLRLTRTARPRPAAEWALPLAVVDAVLLAFGAVQAAVLFGGYTPSLARAGVTYADRAHEGFWQLLMVTLLTIAVLALGGRRADPTEPRHRRLLAVTGGGLVVLALGVVASALRRMWLYEQAYGWTVLRLCVALFELWLGGVLVLVAVAWLLRWTARLPRAVVASAAAVLLGLGLAGPDAVVARWNVDRLHTKQTIDLTYLSGLSADAWPALTCLPPPMAFAALAGHAPEPDPWYAANLSRGRAGAALHDLRAGRARC